MALQASGGNPPQNSIKFSQIENQFGQNGERSLGDYRMNNLNIGALTEVSLDRDGCGISANSDIPVDNQTIKFSDFFSSRQNIIINCHSKNENRVHAKNDKYNKNNASGNYTVVGPGSKPSNTNGKKIIIHVNKQIGSSSAAKNRCALRTGTWNTGTDLRVEVASEGIISGAGGDGGKGGGNSEVTDKAVFISSTSFNSGVTTFNTDGSHKLSVGDVFRVRKSNNNNLGQFTVASVVDDNTFTANTTSALNSPHYIQKRGTSGVYEESFGLVSGGKSGGYDGEHGSSGLGIQYTGGTTIVTTEGNGKIQGGGGGGAGGGSGYGRTERSPKPLLRADGGGGGGGAGIPAGVGGEEGAGIGCGEGEGKYNDCEATSGGNGNASEGGTGGHFSEADQGGEGNNLNGGEGGNGGDPAAAGGEGKKGGGGGGEWEWGPVFYNGGEGGTAGAAIRRVSGAPAPNTSGASTSGSTTATGVS